MLRVFTDKELTPVLRKAEKNSGEFVQSVIHQSKLKATLRSKTSALYLGIMPRLVEGPVIWLMPHLDLHFLAISESLKDRILVFDLDSKNTSFVSQLRRSDYDASQLKNAKHRLKNIHSVNIFLDLFQYDLKRLKTVLDFVKSQKFRTIRLFWSGRDTRAQVLIKQFLETSEATGICWFDERNTVELTINTESLVELISKRQSDYSIIENATKNLSIIPNNEVLDDLVAEICAELNTLFGANISQPPLLSHAPTEEAGAVPTTETTETTDSKLELPARTKIYLERIQAVFGILGEEIRFKIMRLLGKEGSKSSSSNRSLRALVVSSPELQAKAEDRLESLRAVYPIVAYFSECRSHLKPTKILLDLYAYLIRSPRSNINTTLSLAVQQNYQDIRPKVWSELEMYTAYYLYLGSRRGKPKQPPQSREFQFNLGGGGFSHQARYCFNVAIIEYLMGILARQTSETIRWLDIGCGSGKVIHLINPPKLGVHDYECIGVDLAQAKIDMANAYIGKNRKFYCADAFNLPDHIMQGGFHLVTMFEFLEHVEDPVAMIAKAAKLSTTFVMGGSPLEQTITPSQGREHLWSFSQTGYEQLFTANELDLVLSNAMKIGQYANDYDWVTCVASHGLKLSDTNKFLQ